MSLSMNQFEAKRIAERRASEALSTADGDFMAAHELMVCWAEQDPRLREAIRIYVETQILPDEDDCCL
jgi:hypothetical protein